ncbi:acyltransferase family protein [Methylobacterium sp. A54F]
MPQHPVSPQDSDEARLAWVDVAKGISIILVVVMHATLGVGEAMGGEGFLHPVVAFAKPFRMPAFLFLSGLFLGRVIDRDWRRFGDRRVVHFAYFYGLWTLIQSAFKFREVSHGEGAAGFLEHLALALVEPYATLWFIYALAVFSVVTKLLRPVPGPLLLGLGLALQALAPETRSGLVNEFCALYVYFVAGYVLAPKVFAVATAAARRPARALLALAAWAVLNGILALTPTGSDAHPTLASLPGAAPLLGAAGAFALASLAALLVRAGGPLTAALRACGSRSIVIYLAFFLPMAGLRTVLVKTGLIQDIGLASLLVSVAAVLVPLVLARAVRGTHLDILFRRPRAFHIDGPATARPVSLAA